MSNPPTAFWVSPSGSIVPLPQGSRHMDAVAKDPSTFGVDPKDLTADRLRDTRSSPGFMDNNLRLSLVKAGWIRIRHYQGRPWVIECWNLSGSRRKIETWATHCLEQKIAWPQDRAIVVEVPYERQLDTTIGDLSNGVLSESRKLVEGWMVAL